jgi:asparagine synthetase B (glutamine-hydrolysing)
MPLEQRAFFIENFVWRDGSRFDFSAARSLAAAASELPSLSGQFAVHLQHDGRHLLARDPLGVNKLFFTLSADGQIDSSNYLIDLLRRGHRIENTFSVPSGHAVLADTAVKNLALTNYAPLVFNDLSARDGGDCGAWIDRIRCALDGAFRRIQEVSSGRRVYVTMSGGLDSTTIALLARDYLRNIHGVTFCVGRVNHFSQESEDVRFARKVARDLDIPITVVTATPEDLLGLLDDVLMWGQDWRDFNVHCGLVNAVIARALTKMTPSAPACRRPLLLTGDTMNEMMADYTSVKHGEREFYRLPQMSRGRLRRFLVGGLDSGDREVGIFARMGLSVIQPYAMCAQAYLSIPSPFLERANAKQHLAERLMGDRIPAYIRNRPKVRAQAGSATHMGGTLAALLDAGLEQDQLRRRWCDLFELQASDLRGLIRAGFYKFTTTFPTI